VLALDAGVENLAAIVPLRVGFDRRGCVAREFHHFDVRRPQAIHDSLAQRFGRIGAVAEVHLRKCHADGPSAVPDHRRVRMRDAPEARECRQPWGNRICESGSFTSAPANS
jgi:hypothetical protein